MAHDVLGDYPALRLLDLPEREENSTTSFSGTAVIAHAGFRPRPISRGFYSTPKVGCGGRRTRNLAIPTMQRPLRAEATVAGYPPSIMKGLHLAGSKFAGGGTGSAAAAV
ncbi:hypothetical protein PSCLAVI8L_460021 [Pseudoclavibacter sp. 8L]|nr:hypothetical protein PSCLAVI8L_460021 [Pseudoclavibacter sp. 8L]